MSNILEHNTYDLLTWVDGPFTLTFDGDTLGLSSPLNGGEWYYQAYSDLASGASVLATDSEFGGNAVLFSNLTSTMATTQHVASVVVQNSNFICLLAGTMIATPDGERPVEDLRPADRVLTPDGDAVAIRWVGRQSAQASVAGPNAIPVMIRAGALDDGVPVRDLFVSPDHAVLVDGLLINAKALVNGITILSMPHPPAVIEYFHLELDRHRLILADGAPVESFVDDVTREDFDNADEWLQLGLEPLPRKSLPYVKVKSARQLPSAVSNRLLHRAHISNLLVPAW